MKFKLLSVFVIGFTLVLMNSCKKEDTNVENEFITSSEDMTTQQDILESNETEISDQIEQGLVSLESRGFPTRTWTNPKGTFPNTLTIDYGTAGVTGPHGHVRKGKIIIDISAPITQTAAIRVVNHENFYIDDVLVEGTVTLTNAGLNSTNQLVFLRTVADRKLTLPSGKTISWNATQTLTQLEGGSTPDIKLDDVWSINGVSSGVNRGGKNFTVTTTEPLVSKFTCRWVVEGVINLVVESKVLSIDFGDGACNNVATVTLPDGTTKEVNIKRWW